MEARSWRRYLLGVSIGSASPDAAEDYVNRHTSFGLTFSTGADFTAIGQAVLSSSLLPPHVTRQWLKPTSNTPDLRFAVGMPWEIIRVDVPVVTNPESSNSTNSNPPPARLVDLYTKNGGIGAYYAQFALSPDHGFGFVVFVAGLPPRSGPDSRFADMMLINQLTSEAMLSAFEIEGLNQAIERFVGTYTGVENESLTLTIVAGDGGLGLGVWDWRSGDKDLLKSYFAALHGLPLETVESEPSLRLYPVGLQDDKQIAFRGVYEPHGNAGGFSQDGRPFSGACAAWGAVAEPPYGNLGLDDFVFDLNEAGEATGVIARGFRQVLQRKGPLVR